MFARWEQVQFLSEKRGVSWQGKGLNEAVRLRHAGTPGESMSSDDSGGLMSSAGLVRYFDAEDSNAIRIDPKTVVAFSVMFGVLILVLNIIT